MKYDPDLILTVDFGKYKEKNHGKSYTVPQLIMSELGGFEYLDYILGVQLKKKNPNEKNPRKNYRMDPESYSQTKAILKVFRDFQVRVRCQGRYGECREDAVKHAIPYYESKNYRKIMKKNNEKAKEMPDDYRILDPLNSSFVCRECAKDIFHEREGRVLFTPISFSPPVEVTDPKKRDGWSLHMGIYTRKNRKIASMLTVLRTDQQIDPGIKTRIPINLPNAQIITNKLIGLPRDIQRRTPETRGFKWSKDFSRKDYDLSEDIEIVTKEVEGMEYSLFHAVNEDIITQEGQ